MKKSHIALGLAAALGAAGGAAISHKGSNPDQVDGEPNVHALSPPETQKSPQPPEAGKIENIQKKTGVATKELIKATLSFDEGKKIKGQGNVSIGPDGKIIVKVGLDFGGVWFHIYSNDKKGISGAKMDAAPIPVVPKTQVVVPIPVSESPKTTIQSPGVLKSEMDRLLSEAKSFHTNATWVKNKPNTSVIDGFTKTEINSNVSAKIDEYKATLMELGLNDGHIASLKQIISDLIYEHYTKNGRSLKATESYVRNDLISKIDWFFNELKKIYDTGDHPYKNSLDLMDTFSKYSGFGFYGSNAFDKRGLRELAITEKADYERLIGGFKAYASIQKKLAQS